MLILMHNRKSCIWVAKVAEQALNLKASQNKDKKKKKTSTRKKKTKKRQRGEQHSKIRNRELIHIAMHATMRFKLGLP